MKLRYCVLFSLLPNTEWPLSIARIVHMVRLKIKVIKRLYKNTITVKRKWKHIQALSLNQFFIILFHKRKSYLRLDFSSQVLKKKCHVFSALLRPLYLKRIIGSMPKNVNAFCFASVPFFYNLFSAVPI